MGFVYVIIIIVKALAEQNSQQCVSRKHAQALIGWALLLVMFYTSSMRV